jgi:hypothetical protein
MSFLRRKSSAPTREYESWLPDATAAAEPSAGADPASTKSGRSRNSAEHLQAAVVALDAAAARQK